MELRAIKKEISDLENSQMKYYNTLLGEFDRVYGFYNKLARSLGKAKESRHVSSPESQKWFYVTEAGILHINRPF